MNKETDVDTWLVKSQWGQGYPYNIYVPDGYLLGCVATAASQVMHYYRWPLSGSGILPSYDVVPEVDLSLYTYDWDKMPNRATPTMTEDEKQNVALIGYHVAVASQAYFAPETPAFYDKLADSLRTNFGYDEDILEVSFYEETDSYTDTDLIKILTRSILAGHPVLMGDSGHAFIVDGIDDNDPTRFHFNFGFEGVHDGFYPISAPYLYYPLRLIVYSMIPSRINPIHLSSSLESTFMGSNVTHNQSFDLKFSLKNDQQSGISVAAFITTLAGIPVEMASEGISLSGGAFDISQTLPVCIPADSSVGPRTITLCWRDTAPGSDWRKVRTADGHIQDNIRIHIDRRENTDVLLKKTLPPLSDINAGQPFSMDIVTTGSVSPVTFFLCIVDKNDNVIRTIAQSQPIPAVNGSVLTVRLNGQTQYDDAYKTLPVKVFYRLAQEPYLFLLAPAEEGVINSSVLQPVTVYSPAQDLTLTALSGLPADLALAWDRNFTINFTITADNYSNNGSRTEVWINLTDKEGRVIEGITGDSVYVDIPENGSGSYSFTIENIPQLLQVPEGEYNLNILVRYLKDHYLEYHLVPAAGDDINNPVKVRMTHPVRTQDVRLYEAIDIPATMSSSGAYTLEVLYTLLTPENNPSENIIYQFNSAIVFTPWGRRGIRGRKIRVFSFCHNRRAKPLALQV